MAQNPHPFVPWLTAARRAWLYRVAVALVPLLTAFGVASESDAALIVGVIAAVLSTGTAALHTPKES